jgi:hypothetical protein
MSTGSGRNVRDWSGTPQDLGSMEMNDGGLKGNWQKRPERDWYESD